MEDRAVELGRYIARERATVRSAAQHFGLSKSSVHKDVTTRLRDIDGPLWAQVRHLRGGQATREKYRRLHETGTLPESR